MAFYDSPTREGVFPESIRVKYTVMELLVHHPLVGEVIVVDNNPHPDNPLPGFFKSCGPKVRYVAMPEPQGTSAPRNRVFQEARLPYVACVDSHVKLYHGFFEALDAFYLAHGPQCPDLLHGPLMNEAGAVYGTHMNDQWRDRMWGTWGTAWRAPSGFEFSCVHLGNEKLVYATLGNTFRGKQGRLENPALPDIGWSGHEFVLMKNGFTSLHSQDDAFLIPGHGMGFFACRKDAWLPFHEKCLGFGGEEMTTHYRYRAAGREVWCVPGAKWWHDFQRPTSGTRGGAGAPYPLTLWDRMRNYGLEFARLGMDVNELRAGLDAGVDPVHRIPEAEWKQALQGVEWPAPDPNATPYAASTHAASRNDPKVQGRWGQKQTPEEKPVEQVKRAGCAGQPPAAAVRLSLEMLYQRALTTPSHVSDDAKALHDLALKSKRIVELGTHAAVSTTLFLHAEPDLLVTFHPAPVPATETLLSVTPEKTQFGAFVSPDTAGELIPECDLLFINSEPHDAAHTLKELTAHAGRVTRFIAVHGTRAYGERHGPDPGVLPALRGFVRQNPEWKCVARHETVNGLVVLSKDPEDVPPAGPVDLGAPAPAPAPGRQPTKVPDFGPGTELVAIFEGLGKTTNPACDCKGKAAQMNVWGVAGCRANFWTIVGWLKDNAVRWGWADAAPDEPAARPGVFARMGTAIRVVFHGLTFKIDPEAPFEGFVIEAITRAEAKEKEKAQAGQS